LGGLKANEESGHAALAEVRHQRVCIDENAVKDVVLLVALTVSFLAYYALQRK
jgi:hypothetical protein